MAGVAFWQQDCRCVALLLHEHILDLALLLVYSWPCTLFPLMLKSLPYTNLGNGIGIKN